MSSDSLPGACFNSLNPLTKEVMCLFPFLMRKNKSQKIRQDLSLIKQSSGVIYNKQIHNKIGYRNDK